ncbi:hypothetical protein [Gaetbulibacter saemankumensis]|uniref:hypothetical protein n=1 Tax=Gaetbulibacter saemankumensis TaxID=311208 RepID=UPI0004011DCC|nr:hypothetical protein [Gaetbulibacter saemankumensis]
MNTLEELKDKIATARDLDFGDIINESIEVFKKIWMKGLFVVSFVVIIALCLGLLFSAIGLSLDPNIYFEGFELEAFIKFYYVNALYSIPQTILVSTATLAFVGAFYRICDNVLAESEHQDDYFYFFKKEYFTKVFMLGIIYTGIATIAQLLCGLPYIYVFVPLSYFAVILAKHPELSETEIVKASFALGNKKWLLTFGTLFVAALLGMLGIIGCGIGVLFTISIAYLPPYLIYRNSIEKTDLEDFQVTDDNISIEE